VKNHTSKNQAYKLEPGTIITGKWHNNTYRIIRSLGYGATGYVYLAESKAAPVALKISDNGMAITSEVNVLRHFSKVQGTSLGPSLIDVDDWSLPGMKYVPFYAMEYVNGENFTRFIQSRGAEWSGILMLQLLADLDRLHSAGWVFGDLKPDNLLVVGPPPKVRWLDVGGTTLIGRSIKEYTEFFDRGYWGLGSRKAEPSYDLFASSMIMINTAYPNRFDKLDGGFQQLKKAIENKKVLVPYRKVLFNALNGHYTTAISMRDDLLDAMTQNMSNVQKEKGQAVSSSKKTKGKVTRVDQKKTRATRGIMESILITVFLLLAYVLYLYRQFM
jgi:serine/threonine protein kinase, bacterial